MVAWECTEYYLQGILFYLAWLNSLSKIYVGYADDKNLQSNWSDNIDKIKDVCLSTRSYNSLFTQVPPGNLPNSFYILVVLSLITIL